MNLSNLNDSERLGQIEFLTSAFLNNEKPTKDFCRSYLEELGKILTEYCKPQGDAFKHVVLDYMINDGLISAPASTKYHCCCEGGLLQHSAGVLYYLISFVKMNPSKFEKYSMLEIVSAALFHDICKLGMYYKVDHDIEPNVKTDFAKVKTYKAYGHGVESVIRLKKYFSNTDMYLHEDVYEAIRWHMGLYDLSKYDDNFYDEAKRRNPLVLALHYSDDLSSSWDNR